MIDPTPGIPHLERGLLSDQIYTLVRTMIRDSTLQPGEQLVESQLARQLQVSQSPVREALLRLTHDGLVTQVPRQGSFVAAYSRDEVEAARAARVGLEELAARFVCGRLRRSERVKLESLIDDMARAAADADMARFRELDFAFHRSVIVVTGNTFLPRMWDVIEPSLRSLHVLSDPNFTGDWNDVADTHRDLLHALDDGDSARAAKLFRIHASGHTGLARRSHNRDIDVPAEGATP